MAPWEYLFDGLNEDLVAEVKDGIASLLDWAKSDSSDFIREQGLKLEAYMNQLAAGEITREQLEGYLRDNVRLLEMQKLKLQVAEKAQGVGGRSNIDLCGASMAQCIDEKLGSLITLYELNQLSEKERLRFEEHLLECDFCYQELKGMNPIVFAIRENGAVILKELQGEGLGFDSQKQEWLSLPRSERLKKLI